LGFRRGEPRFGWIPAKLDSSRAVGDLKKRNAITPRWPSKKGVRKRGLDFCPKIARPRITLKTGEPSNR